jgi:hypothetical protein
MYPIVPAEMNAAMMEAVVYLVTALGAALSFLWTAR